MIKYSRTQFITEFDSEEAGPQQKPHILSLPLEEDLRRQHIIKMVGASLCVKSVLVLGSLVSFIICVALNAYLNIPGLSPFNETIGNISDKYDTGITPSGATFSIWGVIYTWQLALTIYCVTLLFRKLDSQPLIQSPGFIPVAFFVFYIINLLGNPVWIAVYLSENNPGSLVVLLLLVVSLIVCLGVALPQLYRKGAEMEKRGLKGDIWATRILVHNGIAIYLGWVTCATLINFVTVLVYNFGRPMDQACIGALVVLILIIIAWVFCENYFDKYMRYVFGHYIAYVAAATGIVTKNYNPAVPYTILELAILILLGVLAGVKIVVMAVRSPIVYTPASQNTEKKSDKGRLVYEN